MARIGRHVLVDVSPLRRSRDLRCLVVGQLLSTLGAQLTMVAVAYQVYALTRTVNAMFQALFQVGQVAGPAVAGLLLAGAGVRFVYWVDVASIAVAVLATFLISPQPPQTGASHPPG